MMPYCSCQIFTGKHRALVRQGMSERFPATNPFQKRTERRRSSAVQGPQAWKSFESVLKMHNLSPHPRLVNSNQLLTTSTGNFYVYTSWRHILEIRFCISNKLPSNVNTAGARQGPYHRECKQREETLRTFQGCPYPTNGTKDAMYAEDVYKTQTPLPRKFNIIWKCTEHPLCQPTEASNYPREECWKQLELLTFFLVSSMHDRLLSSV